MRQAQDQLSRREWFRYTGVFAGVAAVARWDGSIIVFAGSGGTEVPRPPKGLQTPADPLDERRETYGGVTDRHEPAWRQIW